MKKITIKTLQKRIHDGNPKRILSLDGGGTKGIVTIAMLQKLEQSIKEFVPEDERENFRLNQYFDYIGGTSTGSIIAVLLSLGFSTESVRVLYRSLSKDVFGCNAMTFKKIISCGIYPSYKAGPIEKLLKKVLGDRKLGDAELMNLLAIFTKNTHTNNIWTFNNNPNSKYYDSPADYPDAFANKEQYLRDLVRASTAAPIYFPPKKLRIRNETSNIEQFGEFIDGGVSMENNPAFRLFMMTTLPYYNKEQDTGLWQTGEKNLLLMSFGTGLFTYRHKGSIMSLIKLPDMYMSNSSQTTDTILRGL